MRVFQRAGGVEIASVPDDARRCVVALGNFDGVHGGHRGVVSMAMAIARSLRAPSGAVTFEPHPRGVLRPDDPPFRLTPLPAKLRLLEELGLDFTLVLAFDEALRTMGAETFVSKVLVGALGVRHVVFGHDFAFGKGRGGNAAALEALGASLGFGVTAVPPIKLTHGATETRFASTAIREALREGDPRAAAALLGYPFEIEGVVAKGDQRGRTIGFPTANLSLGDHMRPAFGVYAVMAKLADDPGEPWRAGVANLGTRPTVDGVEERLETHIFDFAQDIYGRPLRVRLIERIRPEIKFASFEALRQQIVADALAARGLLADDLADHPPA